MPQVDPELFDRGQFQAELALKSSPIGAFKKAIRLAREVLDERFVAEGDMVQKGQHIGAMGSTGYSTGSHLHFEIRIGSHAVSPEMLFSEGAGLYSLLALMEPDA